MAVTKSLLPAAWLLSLTLPLSATSQDTTIVRADNAPLWGDKPTIVEELRIGQLDGPDEYVFGRISALAVRTDGDIFVVDAQVPIIRQYDSTGRYVRDIGREGGGPGEYRQIMGLHIHDDGRLAIFDPANTRLSIYDSTGVFSTSHRVESGFYSADVFAVDTLGNYYVKTVDRSRVETRNGVMVEQLEMPFVFLKISPDGEVVDTLDVPPRRETERSFVLSTTEGYRWYFPGIQIHTLGSDGRLIAGQTTTYALHLEGDDGVVHRITRSVQPIALRGPERAQWQAWADFFERRSRDRGGAMTYAPPPRTKPVFRGLSVDADGRIWVERYGEAYKDDVEPREPGDARPLREWREPPTFDVIRTDGTFLGTVVLPKDVFASYKRGWHVWGVYSGELREPYVVRLRIEPDRR